jgi:uncharacterized phage infection (PIP) family protein YhgE
MADFKISIDTELKTSQIDSQISEIKSKLENAVKDVPLSVNLNQVNNQIDDLQTRLRTAFGNINANVNFGNATQQAEQLGQNLRTATDNFNSIGSGGGGNNANNQLLQLTQGAQDASEQIRGTATAVEESTLSYQEWNVVLNACIDTIKSFAEQTFEMDSALTDFKKVSDLSGDSLDQYVNKLQDLGSTVARTG